MAKRRKHFQPDEPLRHPDHPRPVTRRDFIRQGFMTGAAMVTTGSVFSLFANPRAAYADVSADLDALATDINCQLGGVGAADLKVPFICFDLAGGANLAGSNVLVGQGLEQTDFLSTAGYSKLGLPGDMIPGLDDANFALLNPSNGLFINDELGLLFHADSNMLFGIREKAGLALTQGGIDGAVIPARSDNDTGNNPHNPMYGIAAAGAKGGVVTLIGSRSSDSGGNSMAPAAQINPEIRPTKVDRPSDVTGMVDVGDLTAILSDPADVTAVMESMARISHKKMSLGTIDTGVTRNDVIKDLVRCGYLKAADIAERFAGVPVNPDDRADSEGVIVGPGRIFTEQEFDGDGEFRKTASVMKMVIDGHAGAGCITMGGYDYHTGDRSTGELRDLRAGRCIGACLAYAAIMGQPLMIYVFSDGSVFSNGSMDGSVNGRGKGVWTGDNSSTACSYFLAYNPNGAVSQFNTGLTDNSFRQIGRFTSDASVMTSSSPAANNVNLLVNTVVLNYMALNGDVTSGGNTGAFTSLFPNHGLTNLESLIAFGSIAS
jgi:hypothetical protein